jgi:hypothetical protein
MKLKKYGVSDRGFIGYEFEDLYDSKCSIQESSLATKDAIWFGVHKPFDGNPNTRMHLTREMVKKLLPLLELFVETGSIHPKAPAK